MRGLFGAIGIVTTLVAGQAFGAQECLDLTGTGGSSSLKAAKLCIEGSGDNYELKFKVGNKIFIHYHAMKKVQAVCVMAPCYAPTTYSPATSEASILKDLGVTINPNSATAGTVSVGGTKFNYKKPGAAAGECKKGGCSGQLCYDPAWGSGVSTCEFRPEYGCYRNAECKRQADGKCDFTQTQALKDCLKSFAR